MRRSSIAADIRQVARGWRWGHRPLLPRMVESAGDPKTEFPTAWARSQTAVGVRRMILGAGFAPLLQSQLSITREGLETLENLKPPVIFVANHSSHLDAPLILTSLPASWRDRTAAAAAADYFFDVWWRAVSTALAFNAFPIGRAGSRRSAGLGRKLLDQGWSLLVFPEGTRSRDGFMGDFKHGAAGLAVDAGVPVIPIAVLGAYQAMPPDRPWPLPGRPAVGVRFGAPVWPGDQSVPQMTDRIHQGLSALLDEGKGTWWKSLKSTKLREGREEELKLAPEALWRRKWESSMPLPSTTDDRVWKRKQSA